MNVRAGLLVYHMMTLVDVRCESHTILRLLKHAVLTDYWNDWPPRGQIIWEVPLRADDLFPPTLQESVPDQRLIVKQTDMPNQKGS